MTKSKIEAKKDSEREERERKTDKEQRAEAGARDKDGGEKIHKGGCKAGEKLRKLEEEEQMIRWRG